MSDWNKTVQSDDFKALPSLPTGVEATGGAREMVASEIRQMYFDFTGQPHGPWDSTFPGARDMWRNMVAHVLAAHPPAVEGLVAAARAVALDAWTDRFVRLHDSEAVHALDRALKAYDAAALSQQASPSEAGEWVLVPKEPTEAMLSAWDSYRHNASGTVAWEAMLTASVTSNTGRGG